MFFFFKQKTAYEMRISDWSSDVCSSDLIYHSLMGVPIRRSERVHGVLVIQHSAVREYTEEEAESLETLSMVLAEMISGGEIPGAVGRGDGAPVDRTSVV